MSDDEAAQVERRPAPGHGTAADYAVARRSFKKAWEARNKPRRRMTIAEARAKSQQSMKGRAQQ
jgi:hypothetical protein